MPYRFALAPVLRVRELAAERVEQTLARITAEIERLRAALEQNARDLLETGRARQQALASAALPAMHLHASYARAAEHRAREAALRKQLQAFEQLRVQQVARYQEAYRSREVLVSLQAEQRSAWNAGEAKREAKAADEAFLGRYARALREARS